MINRKHRNHRSRTGQSLVEFALAIPFLLLIIFATIYFGRVFYTKQIVTMATQEGARQISRIPNLQDNNTRDIVKGFTTSGQATNPNSTVYAALASGRLLSQGVTGDLPPGSKVKVLPWDSDGSAEDYTPPGTIGVRVEYPFVCIGSPFASSGNAPAINIWSGPDGAPISLLNFQISERAVASTEVYQEGM